MVKIIKSSKGMLFPLFCPDSQCLVLGTVVAAEGWDCWRMRNRIPGVLSDCRALRLQLCSLMFNSIIYLLFKSARLNTEQRHCSMYLSVQIHIFMHLQVKFLVVEVGLIISLDLQPSWLVDNCHCGSACVTHGCIHICFPGLHRACPLICQC